MSQLNSIGGYQPIQGNLPFGGGGAAFGQAIGGPLGQGYMSAYNSALQQNQQQYQNILGGYQQVGQQQQQGQQAIQGGYNQLGQQMGQQLQGSFANTGAGQYAAQQNIGAGYNQLGNQVQGYLGGMGSALNQQQQNQQGIQAGYGQLQGNVLGTIEGITRSQSQNIADVYAQQSGQLSQDMINRGLGNTTAQGSMQRGVNLDEQKAQIALANQQAQLTAGYQSQLGLAGLGYANQASQQNTQQQNLLSGQQAAYGNQIGQAGLGYQNQANMQNTQLRNQSTDLQAQYANQIGQAGLQYGNQANMQNTMQANNQLGFMNSVQMQYPNAQSYGQLSSAQAALQAQQAANAQGMDLYKQGLQFSRGAGMGAPAPPIGSAPGMGNIPFSAGMGGGGGYSPGGGGGQGPPQQLYGSSQYNSPPQDGSQYALPGYGQFSSQFGGAGADAMAGAASPYGTGGAPPSMYSPNLIGAVGGGAGLVGAAYGGVDTYTSGY